MGYSRLMLRGVELRI